MKERQNYIDNIRVYLTMLVIFHHTAVTYGASGGWYYKEPVEGLVPGLLLTVFVATNQAFFMGLFFFLASYFIPASYERKGPATFMADRLKRLGIPIIFYCLVISPVTIYIMIKLARHSSASFLEYYVDRDEWIEVGVLWFTTALLLFTGIYWMIRSVGSSVARTPTPLPGNGKIFLFAFALGIISFLVRIFFPIGWVLSPLGFQPAHFTQYIAFFTLGIFAFRNNWLSGLTSQHAKLWLRVSLGLIFIGFPAIYVLKIVTNAELNSFLGGFTIQSFANAIWEQVLGVSLSVALLATGKIKWNEQGKLMKEFSRSAYAVYIIHPMIVVLISLLVKDITMSSLLKFLLVGATSVAICFSVGSLLTRIPGVRNII